MYSHNFRARINEKSWIRNPSEDVKSKLFYLRMGRIVKKSLLELSECPSTQCLTDQKDRCSACLQILDDRYEEIADCQSDKKNQKRCGTAFHYKCYPFSVEESFCCQACKMKKQRSKIKCKFCNHTWKIDDNTLLFCKENGGKNWYHVLCLGLNAIMAPKANKEEQEEQNSPRNGNQKGRMEELCVICKKPGDLIGCSGSTEDQSQSSSHSTSFKDHKCDVKMHPICAFFVLYHSPRMEPTFPQKTLTIVLV